MTEAELFESMQMAYANGIACYALFMTIVGAYVVSAYLAGRNLTSSQLRIVNFLFLSSTIVLTVAILSHFYTADEFLSAIIEKGPSSIEVSAHGRFVTIISVLINIAIMIAGLKFMYDSRKG